MRIQLFFSLMFLGVQVFSQCPSFNTALINTCVGSEYSLVSSNVGLHWYYNTNETIDGALDLGIVDSESLTQLANQEGSIYYFIINDTIPSCVLEYAVVIVHPSNAFESIDYSPLSICTSDSVVFSASSQSDSLIWQTSSDESSFVSAPLNTDIFSTGLLINSGLQPTHLYYRAIAASAYCPSDTSEIFEVSVFPQSIAGMISSDTTICSGTSASFSTEGYVGGIQWRFAVGNNPYTNITGATSATLNTGNLSANGANSQFRYYYAVVTSGVCPSISSDTLSLEILPKPIIPLPQQIEICSGDFFEFAPVNGGNLTVPAQTVYSYTYTDNINVSGETEGVDMTGVSAELVSSLYAQQTVVYNVIPSSYGCVGNAFTLNVNLKPAPNLIASADMAVCEGESAQLFAIDLFNIANTYFDWTGSEQLGSINFPYISNPTVSPDSTAIYIVQMFDPIGGCNAVDSVVVTVSEWPQFGLVSPSIICGQETAEIQITGTTDAQFEAMVLGGTLIGVDNQIVSVAAGSANELVVTIDAISEAGCTTTVVESIAVGQLPFSTILGPDLVCANSYYQEYSISPTSNFLNWQIQNGEIMNGLGTNEIMVHWFEGDGGSLTLNESDANTGCSNASDYSVSFDGLAPDMEEIALLAANQSILYCVNSSFDIYQWGYTTASTNQDFYTGGSSQYHNFGTLDVANYFYWVEHGDDGSCLTRSYYNAPPIVTAILDGGSATDNDFIVYPNPVNDVLTISSKNWTHNAKLEVLTSTGTMLDSRLHSGYSMPLDLSKYSVGIYFVKLTTANSIQVFPIVKR